MNDHAETIEPLFACALERPREDRATFLDKACSGNAPLRGRLEALLRAHDQAGDFLQAQPQWPQPANDAPAPIEGPGERIGAYKLLQQIGSGGMGVVYMAEQERPVRRKVALKIIRPGMDSAQVIARFEAERQALALMDHLNIARVFDAGTTDGGRPYFVMELVHGVSITKYCDENELTPDQRLELFVPVCQAIQHAHQRGIIHRDIKPSNVLVTLYDGKPAPKVIDFGVAKAIEQRLTERTMFTQYGTIVGTFEYMAPEQAEMSALGVDTRSDIYSLGVLLYELLTGTTPLERKRVTEASYPDVVRMIKEEEPQRPSRLLSTSNALRTLSRQRGTEPAKLPNLIKGELDWIVMKCLEKDRARRYDSASSLARDVERYLADEPVEACPPSTAYKLQKLARKHKTALATATAFVLMLIFGALIATWHAVRASLAETEATRQRDVAAAAEKEATQQRDDARKVSAQLQLAQQEVRGTLYATHMNLARAAWEANNIGRVRELLELTRPRPGERDLRDFEWHYWSRQCHTELLTIPTAAASGHTLAISQDGTRVATTEAMSAGERNATSIVRIRDVLSGKETVTVKLNVLGHLPGDRAWSPEGTRLAIISGRNVDPSDQEIKVLDAASGAVIVRIRGFNTWIRGTAFSPDSRFIAGMISSSNEPREQPEHVRIWNVATGTEILKIGGARTVAFSPDSNRVAAPVSIIDSQPRQTEVKLWDIAAGKELLVFEQKAGAVGNVAFSSAGKRLAGAVVSIDEERKQAIQVWETGGGKELFQFAGVYGVSDGLKFDPSGTRLAAAVVATTGGQQQIAVLDAVDSTVKVWNIEPRQAEDDSRLLLTLKGHTGLVTRIAFNRDGRRLVSHGIDGTVKLWDATDHPESLVVRIHGRPVGSAFNPQLGRIAVVTQNIPRPVQEVEVWDFSDAQSPALKSRRHFDLSQEGFRRALLSRDGTRLATLARITSPEKVSGMEIKLWDVATSKSIDSVKIYDNTLPSNYITLSPDLRRIAYAIKIGATALGPNELRIWDCDAAKDVLKLQEPNVRLGELTFSPDGTRIAATLSDADGLTIKVWDVENGTPLFASSLARHFSIRGLVFSPDASRITARIGFRYGPDEVNVWDAASGNRVTTLKGHSGRIVDLDFSPDGRRIASVAAREGAWAQPSEVKLWDSSNGRELLTFQGPSVGGGHHLGFSLDGNRLYQAGPKLGTEKDFELKVWGAAPAGEP